MATQQTLDFNLSFKLPKLAGNYVVPLQVTTLNGATAKVYGDYPTFIDVLSATNYVSTNDLITQLNALTFNKNSQADKQKRNNAVLYLQKAIKQLGVNDVNGTLNSLIAAIDAITAINSKDMSTFRLALDNWLQEVERQWVATGKPNIDYPHDESEH